MTHLQLRPLTRARSLPLVLAALSGLGSACNDDADAPSQRASADAASPLYAMMVQVYDTDDRTVYIALSDTLDLDPEIDLSRAREFLGVANFAPVGGRLLVSSGTEPTITAFEISQDMSWNELDSISFANYPFEDNANFYYQYILNDHTAYMPFETTKRVVWNPTEMRIEEIYEDSELELTRDGLEARVGGNRNAIRFQGPVQQPFFYADDDYFETGPESVVAIYDEKTHEERALVTLPCPGLSMASQDEKGYTYYGTWGFQGTRALYGVGPEPCIARLKPDLTLDSDWTTDLKGLTDGRYSNNFRYIGKGKAIANVLHHELIDADWSGGYDADIAEKIDNESGEHWRLWWFDLDKRQAKPVDGIDVAIGSGAQFAVLDGRTFVFVPYEDWGKTKIYELDDQGNASLRASTTGDVFKWVKIR